MLEKISKIRTLEIMADNLKKELPPFHGLMTEHGHAMDETDLQVMFENGRDEFAAYIQKPTRTITLELPMPLTELPENNSKVWVVDLDLMSREGQMTAYEIIFNCNEAYHIKFLNSGLIYATEQDAKAAHEKLKAKFSIDNIVEGE